MGEYKLFFEKQFLAKQHKLLEDYKHNNIELKNHFQSIFVSFLCQTNEETSTKFNEFYESLKIFVSNNGRRIKKNENQRISEKQIKPQ
jgi:hypothetical protein